VKEKEHKIYKYDNNELPNPMNLRRTSTINRNHKEIVRENDQFIDKEYRILIRSFVKGYIETN